MKTLSTKLGFCAALATLLIAYAHAAEDPPKVVKKVPPEFPANVAESQSGIVKARLTIDAQGNVTDVAVTEAQPPRLFNIAATTALKGWRFEPSGKPQSYDVKLVFSGGD